jgi:uroporphyrinogen-III synthase
MRLLVTRATDDARRTAERLTEQGHETVLSPVIEVALTGEPMPPGPFNAIIVTSHQAAPALADWALRDLPVFAVGERTGEAIQAAGFRDIRTAAGDARSIVRMIQAQMSAPARLLQAAGRQHKPEPAASLLEAGFEICPWIVYEARAVAELGRHAVAAIARGEVDGVLHYSRRSAELFLRHAQRERLVEPLGTLAHFALSEDVAQPLREAGFTVVCAEAPSEGALLALLAGTGLPR